ncbi:MAG: CPBP family intramembrane glutamic endopeptidase [Bacteroidales bacterium]
MQNRTYHTFGKCIVILILSLILGFAVTILILASLGKLVDGKALLNISITIQNLLIFIIPTIITASLIVTNPTKFLNLKIAPKLGIVITAIIIMVAATPALNYIIALNESIKLPDSLNWLEEWMRNNEDSAKAVTDQLLHNNNIFSLILTILTVGVLTGAGEELFFRGALQGIFLSRKGANIHIAIWLTAFIFSAIHFQFYGFVPRLLLGAYFGYLVYWTGSLWVPIIIHALNNSSVVITEYMLDKNIITTNINQIGVPVNGIPWLAIGSTLVTILLLIIARQYIFNRIHRY